MKLKYCKTYIYFNLFIKYFNLFIKNVSESSVLKLINFENF